LAYDEQLAERIRTILASVDAVSERRMFGGIAFMVGGNMACGVIGDELMVRVGADGHDDALREPHVRVMDFTNRPSRGMVYVGVPAITSDADLERWVSRASRSLSPCPRSSHGRASATDATLPGLPTEGSRGAPAGPRARQLRHVDAIALVHGMPADRSLPRRLRR